VTAVQAERAVMAAAQQPGRLLVLYDADCPLCVRCRQFLEAEATHLPLDFMGSASPEAIDAFGEDLPWLGKELVVVSDRGEAWIGPAAFLVALWATVHYREWSYRLSSKALAPLAVRFFNSLSSNRVAIGLRLSPPPCPDGRCDRHGP
jgi:predicted DCC family thiol-disulfide oxidoreductase YuxK